MEYAHHFDERDVALDVAVHVVVDLEMVEVEHDERKHPPARPRQQKKPFELVVEKMPVIRFCQIIDKGAPGRVDVIARVDDLRKRDRFFDVRIIVERRDMDADVPAEFFGKEILVLEDLLPVAFRLLFGQPDLDERENQLPVIGAGFLAD